MTKSQRFKPIQKIAEKKERDAASVFGQSLRDRDEAQKRLQDLEHYLDEYLQRFNQASRQGIGAERIRDYQVFIDKLETAIREQKRVLLEVQERCDDSKAQWHGHFTKVRAVDNAVERMRDDELKVREKKEQAHSDEHGQRRR